MSGEAGLRQQGKDREGEAPELEVEAAPIGRVQRDLSVGVWCRRDRWHAYIRSPQNLPVAADIRAPLEKHASSGAPLVFSDCGSPIQ